MKARDSAKSYFSDLEILFVYVLYVFHPIMFVGALLHNEQTLV